MLGRRTDTILDSFNKFSQVANGAVRLEDVDSLLKNFQAPLHISWLKFVACELDGNSPPSPRASDVAQGWSPSNWQTVLGFP